MTASQPQMVRLIPQAAGLIIRAAQTTFLSVYTPTYRRPFLLELCKASVKGQSVPVEHIIVRDDIGLGIGGMYADLRNHAHLPTGEYVMVLSDDNVLVDADFAKYLEELVREHKPDVVVFQGQIGTTLQPAWWGEPRETMIDLSCFAVRRDLWVAYADRWGARYEGDYDFIRALWDDGHEFCWWRRLAFQALKISRGAAE
jgi:hypothetical protein